MDIPPKSGRQRRLEIREKRRRRALALVATEPQPPQRPLGAVEADPAELVHNSTYDMMPLYYVDRAFTCRDCGSHELWTAKAQKWWYEVAKGNINSFAVRCRPCRRREQARKAEARRVHLEGLARKQGGDPQP
jgi:hypothetical protein